jgi:hypothetical protein
MVTYTKGPQADVWGGRKTRYFGCAAWIGIVMVLDAFELGYFGFYGFEHYECSSTSIAVQRSAV